MRPTDEESAQVLIVGAGPAGAAAGITLAREGLDVCVVDRAHFPRAKACGDALSNRAVRIVESLLDDTPAYQQQLDAYSAGNSARAVVEMLQERLIGDYRTARVA